jgi:hypothetical protein
MNSGNGFTTNFFTARQSAQLINGQNAPFGETLITYQVQRFRDVSNLTSEQAYLVTMMQRVIVPNPTPYQPGPSSATAYSDYPAILHAQVNLSASNTPKIILRNIFPRTLNAQINSSQSENSGTGTSSTIQNTSGSNQSTVNSYGISLSFGFSGTTPLGSITSQSGQSFSSGTMQSTSSGNTNSANQNLGASQSMSIKDWSSFGILDDQAVNPSWLFGQAFPWDVLQYNQLGDNGSINLPDFVKANLYSDGLILPPSQLSQFGIDFSMTANWLLVYPGPISSDETLQFTHTVTSYTASHAAVSGSVSASLQTSSEASTCQIQSPTLSLSKYGLMPLTASGVTSGSAIGFAAADWTIAPTSARGACKVVSPGDTLQVEAVGFDAGMTSDLLVPTSVTLTFKVADYNVDYTLALMHWLGEGSGPVSVAWSVNEGKGSGVFSVEATRGEGAQGNASVIALRNTDFSDIGYHDYLTIGTNTITLTITPQGTGTASYVLNAIGLGTN